MKFANSCRLIKRDAVLDDTWHPLDGGQAPDYVPGCWDGPHVGKRLVEGLRTLMLMPMPRGPQAFVSAWPEFMHDWADQLAQQEAEEADKLRTHREQNRTRVRPSSIEIARMEQSIRWPLLYLRELPRLTRIIMPTVKELQAAGCESLRAIAAGLEERGIPAPRGGKWSAVQVSRLLEAATLPFAASVAAAA